MAFICHSFGGFPLNGGPGLTRAGGRAEDKERVDPFQIPLRGDLFHVKSFELFLFELDYSPAHT